MDYAIENEVGLTPENPHIIYAESSKGSFFVAFHDFNLFHFLAIASCICDPEMPFVNYHYVTENNGEPMSCMCGYFFKPQV